MWPILEEILKTSPVAGTCLLVCWFAARYMIQQQREHLKE
jgi:hypothetical protein